MVQKSVIVRFFLATSPTPDDAALRGLVPTPAMCGATRLVSAPPPIETVYFFFANPLKQAQFQFWFVAAFS